MGFKMLNIIHFFCRQKATTMMEFSVLQSDDFLLEKNLLQQWNIFLYLESCIDIHNGFKN